MDRITMYIRPMTFDKNMIIRMPSKLLRDIDKAVRESADAFNRSDFVRRAIANELERRSIAKQPRPR